MKETGIISELKITREEILADYRLANLSRNLSVIGRREVLQGKQSLAFSGQGRR